MKFSRFLVIILCFLGTQSIVSRAADIQAVRIVTSEDSGFSRETASYLLGLLKNEEGALNVEIGDSADNSSVDLAKQLVVVIGESAAKKMQSTTLSRSPMLLIAPQRVSPDWIDKKNAPVYFIQFEQPLPRLLNLASLVDTRKRHDLAVIGIVATPAMQKSLLAYENTAADRKLKLRIEVVENELAVGRAVANVVDQSNIFLAIPDPLVHTPNTVQPVLLMSYRAGVPVMGYSAAYLRAGATIALYSTPEQIARQAADTITALRMGRTVPAIQAPKSFTVGVNSTVARSLGIDLPAAAAIEERLRSMKE